MANGAGLIWCEGCHDNGYATTLRSQITAGFKHKLILLRGYSDMAAGINELELPSFSIPDLFIQQKLGNPFTSPPGLVHPALAASAAIAPLESLPEAGSPKPAKAVCQQEFDALPFASVDRLDVAAPKERPTPLSYSSAVQTPVKRAETPELDSSGSTSSSDGSEDSLPPRASLVTARSRRVTPNLVRSIHSDLMSLTDN